jgi:hypothetical protein
MMIAVGRVLFLFSLICGVASPTGAFLMAFEVPQLFRASQILPAPLLSGPHHRVREQAEADGYLIHFTVDSDYGVYECSGVAELRRRISEIEAISQLVTVSKGDLFAEGLKKSVESPIAAVKNIASDPGGTIKQVPKSVGHFFGKVGSGIGNAARKAGEKKSGEQPPNPEQVGRGVGRIIKSAAGFDKAKLECARQLGVDPYTDNVRLQEEMEKVTWAFFAGGLPLKIGASLASGGVSQAINATEFIGLPATLYQLTPGELDFRDRNSLKEMGIPAQNIDSLFANPAVIRSVRHQMVSALGELNLAGRMEIVDQLAQCDSVWRAHFFSDALQLLRWRHRNNPYRGLGVHGRLAVGLTADGAVEIPAPIDYVLWTPEVAEFANREDIARFQRRLILQGTLSQETARELAATGWQVVQVPRN